MSELIPFQQKNEWFKPSTLFGAINMVVLLILALNYYYGVEAKSAERLTKIETQIDVYIIPTLRRIERGVQEK